MKILGIETSCDETAAAVVEDGGKVLSNIVASQIDIHAKFGGVVPEIAARSHIEVMLPVVDSALSEAGLSWNDIDGIAVTSGPGLLGSLMIGTLTAKTLAELKQKPLYAINHVEAHAYANFLDNDNPPEFPMLALIVSGGHTQLVLFKNHHNYEVLGITQDDAAGEAFDKIAKLLGLGFPGGPAIEKAAKLGDSTKYAFPKAKMSGLDFSFSGLKTAVLRKTQEILGLDFTAPSASLAEKLSDGQKHDLAASFQKAVLDSLVGNTVKAFEKHQPKSVIIAGGVAANHALREELQKHIPYEMHFASMKFCTDNAAMIAALGYHYAKGRKSTSPQDLEANPVLAM